MESEARRYPWETANDTERSRMGMEPDNYTFHEPLDSHRAWCTAATAHVCRKLRQGESCRFRRPHATLKRGVDKPRTEISS